MNLIKLMGLINSDQLQTAITNLMAEADALKHDREGFKAAFPKALAMVVDYLKLLDTAQRDILTEQANVRAELRDILTEQANVRAELREIAARLDRLVPMADAGVVVIPTMPRLNGDTDHGTEPG